MAEENIKIKEDAIKPKVKTGTDIMDISKVLAEKEKTMTGKDDILGMTLLTLPMYISSSRAIMFTSHLKQFVTLNKPDSPRVFTNYENTVGQLSSSICKAKSNYKVVDKISKFKSIPNHLYYLFMYDKDKNHYELVIKRNAVELTEKFGYAFNNERIDKMKVGDKVKKGETLWKSTSYDEDDLYGYGINAKTAYITENNLIEDAIVCSQSFADKMISKQVESIKVSLNDNDFFCNLYGNGKFYRGFPDINEKIQKNILCAHRRIINGQILFDMKKSNLKEISPLDDRIYYSKSDGGGKVIDIDIFSNKRIEEIPDTDQNEQIIEYLKNQNRFYKEIFNRCEKIIKSGATYCDDIGFWYKRSKDILDPRFKWKDNNSAFSNIIIEFLVERDVGLGIGSKLTGRFGNKGVISKVIPDSEMPFLENGDKIDILFNPLGVVNRLNSAQLYEVSINFISNRINERMNTFDNIKDKEDLLFQYLKFFNDRKMFDKLIEYYEQLSYEEKVDFFNEINLTGIFVNLPPMWESEALFDKLIKIYETFPWVKPYDVYVNAFGRNIKIMNKLIVGEQYIIKMKQDSKKGFSSRSMGFINTKGLNKIGPRTSNCVA